MISAVIIGKKELLASLTAFPGRASDRLRAEVETLAVEMVAHVKQDKLSGSVLKNRTGTLRRSIHEDVESSNLKTIARVGTNVVYAAIHEYGGKTKPHIIEPKNAKMLSWIGSDGNRRFAKVVHHPGSNIPQRSFLRSSLQDMQGTIKERLKEAVGEAIRE